MKIEKIGKLTELTKNKIDERVLLETIYPMVCVSYDPKTIYDASAQEVYDLVKSTGERYAIMAQTFRQSKLLFKEVEKLVDKDEVSRITHDSDSYTINFKNGSVLSSLPATERICGLRFNNIIWAE
jgi:hypothetical protein